MLKLLGAILIVVSCTGIGASYSVDLKQHWGELRMLKQMLYMLRGEIKYTKSPLPEAFEHIAPRLPEPFSRFLAETAEQMENLDGQSFPQLWQAQIDRCLSKTHLRKEEKEQLAALGEVLGYLDLDMQLSSIELYLEQLELAIAQSREALATKQKLYQSLGVAGGIFLVILLV